MELVKRPLYIKIVFSYSGLALMESRVPLGPWLWVQGLLRISLVLKSRLNKTESDVFLYCRFSLFPDYLCSFKLIIRR